MYIYLYTKMKAKYNIVLHYNHIPKLEMQFNVESLLQMYNAQSKALGLIFDSTYKYTYTQTHW